jgi:hypothetical protein
MFYPYVMASLPTLQPGMRPPFSFPQFLERIRGLVPEHIFRALEEMTSSGPARGDAFLSGIAEREIALRNELAHLRAARVHRDAGQYLRPGGRPSISISQAALAAVKAGHLQEGEKLLDQFRWDAAEELSQGHFFDSTALSAYAYKLLLLLRWEAVRSADTDMLLKSIEV